MTETPLSSGLDEEAAIAAAQSGVHAPGEGGVLGKTGLAWAWFEWARNPYYILIIIYVFAPYFARDIIGADILASGALEGMDPETARQVAGAKGQATVASLSKWAGAIAALTAPFLGAAFDRGLRRKPLLIVMFAGLSALSYLLWWAIPGEAGLPTGAIIIILITAYVIYSFSEVTHNSMLADAARPSALSGVSGLGLALGNGAAALLFIAIILMFALPDMMHWPFAEPLFGIDTAQYEHFRVVGPICAVWIAVMSVPFFLYSKDTGIKGTPFIPAVKQGFAGVVRTVRTASEYRQAFRYLIARTIYADGMFALLALGAVYVSLFLGWGIVELTIFAIWSSIWAAVGGVAGGWFDSKLGPKNALMMELVAIVIVLFIGLSITRESLFFGLIQNREVSQAPFFSNLSDIAYLLNGALISIFAVANISSSRSMLIHVAPSHMRGEFFGLYAIAGTVTVWIGPLLIELFTSWSNSQRVGMSAIALLFFAGLGVLSTVKVDKTPAK